MSAVGRGCCWYHKGTNFQANHNASNVVRRIVSVVVATTKVQIFKQITTRRDWEYYWFWLLLLPQRYKFSSKSQPSRLTMTRWPGCCCYHKGTNFQANHNWLRQALSGLPVVVATTKVQIFKQITTLIDGSQQEKRLLLLPQRYKFSSKSQQIVAVEPCPVLLLLPQRYKFSSKSQLHQYRIVFD